jgi:acetyl esterase/lipase
VAFLYEPATLPEAQTRLDLAYRSDPAAHPEKHHLDLFLPDPALRDWPTLVFVHGGGWTDGDRTIEAAGASVVRNIGRFFASEGVGAAVISYRLMPEVGWREQLEDVAAAMRFVREAAVAEGGDPDAIFLSGHSAGAWLAARTGFDPGVLERAGFPPASLCGLALVSGAAYDLGDEETYRVGASRDYFLERFDDGRPGWERAGSVMPLLREDLPPTLILFGSIESAQLQRQSQLLFDRMSAIGAPVSKLRLPRQTHQSIVLTLSRDDKQAGPAILELMQGSTCS